MTPTRRLDEHFIREVSEILAWAESRGVTPLSRFHKHRKSLEFLIAHDKEDERRDMHDRFAREGRLTEILSTMTESIELVETIPVLRSLGVQIPPSLLRRAFSGPVDTTKENATSNRARNAMFELSVAAMAARGGLKPTLSDSNPDVAFQFEDRSAKLECKRVMSENRIMDRLKEGAKQLEKSVDLGRSDIGIVVISLSKVTNPGDRILESDSPHNTVSGELRRLLGTMEKQLSGLRQPWLAGFIFHLSIASFTPGQGYSPASAGMIFPLDRSKTEFLKRLAASLFV